MPVLLNKSGLSSILILWAHLVEVFWPFTTALWLWKESLMHILWFYTFLKWKIIEPNWILPPAKNVYMTIVSLPNLWTPNENTFGIRDQRGRNKIYWVFASFKSEKKLLVWILFKQGVLEKMERILIVILLLVPMCKYYPRVNQTL